MLHIQMLLILQARTASPSSSLPPGKRSALKTLVIPENLLFLEHPVHLMSEQHILMSKYILSHVGLLFLHVNPKSTADFFFEASDCALYLFCIPYGFHHFADNMQVLNTYLK